MSAKDVEDLKEKVFYIDRRVNPYLNVQIMKLFQLNNNLNEKVKELEEKINSLSESDTPKKTIKTDEQPKKEKKQVLINDIRTINLE